MHSTRQIERALILPTVRPDMFMNLLRSWVACPSLHGWVMLAYFQAYTPAQIDQCYSIVRDAGLSLEDISSDTRVPPYMARAAIYQRWPGVKVYASIDDDMTFWPGRTDYTKAVEMALLPATGVVSCNWVRSNTPALIRRALFEDRFIEQPIVNMSGGMIYSRRTAELLLSWPVKPYIFCDVQVGLVTYVEGFTNYRYLGSHVFHNVMTRGGLKTLYAQQAMLIPDERYMRVKVSSKVYEVGNNYHMPTSTNLTLYAHTLHHANAVKRGLAVDH